jgi:hypothetical protein
MHTNDRRRCAALALLTVGFLALGVRGALAEPMFLSKQYTRCTPCHYSPTGGGLLTPYGRSLTRRELSTTGPGPAAVPASGAAGAQPAAAADTTPGEESFLWGALGNSLGPLQLGFDTRPAHLHFSFPGGSAGQNILFNADLLAAYQTNGWTLYGEIGREPKNGGWTVNSYEYWAAHQSSGGFGIRVGRFLPAYGVRLADHTAFNRGPLGFDVYDQVYGVEVSRTTDRHLLQVSVSPGRADSIIHDDGRRALTATGRYEMDLGGRTSIVASGLFRGGSTLAEKNGAGGAAFGFAPAPRVGIWTEGDAIFQQGSAGTAYIVVNETSVEAIRGLWLKFSPQLRTEPGDMSAGSLRAVFEADALPRTHFNVDLSYYVDRDRRSALVAKTFLFQFHVYL